MISREEALALAANTKNLIAKTPKPNAFQLEQHDRIIAAAHSFGITDAEIDAAR